MCVIADRMYVYLVIFYFSCFWPINSRIYILLYAKMALQILLHDVSIFL